MAIRYGHTRALLESSPAADLTKNLDRVLVILGDHDLSQSDDPGDRGWLGYSTKVVLQRLFRHPSYRSRMIMTADQITNFMLLCKSDAHLCEQIVLGILNTRWYHRFYRHSRKLSSKLTPAHIYRLHQEGFPLEYIEMIFKRDKELRDTFFNSVSQSLGHLYLEREGVQQQACDQQHGDKCFATWLSSCHAEENNILTLPILNLTETFRDMIQPPFLAKGRNLLLQLPHNDELHTCLPYYFALCVDQLCQVEILEKFDVFGLQGNVFSKVKVILDMVWVDESKERGAVALFKRSVPFLDEARLTELKKVRVDKSLRGALCTLGYELGDPLGNGGFGQVFKLWKKDTSDIVVLKILKYSSGAMPNVFDEEDDGFSIHRNENGRFFGFMFYRAAVDTEFIVKFIHSVPLFESCGIILEYIEGKPLDVVLYDCSERNVDLLEWQKINFTQGLIAGIAYLHHIKVTHGDVRPDNVMVVGGKAVKLIDLGSSVNYDSSEDEVQEVITVSDIHGSPEVVGLPQQSLNWMDASKSEIYIFAIVAWQIWNPKQDIFDTEEREQEHTRSIVNKKQPLLPVDQILQESKGSVKNLRLAGLFGRCWKESCSERPTAQVFQEEFSSTINLP